MKFVAIHACLLVLVAPALATGPPFDITVNADGGYLATCTFSHCGSLMSCDEGNTDAGAYRSGKDLKGGSYAEAAPHFGSDCWYIRSTLCCMKKA